MPVSLLRQSSSGGFSTHSFSNASAVSIHEMRQVVRRPPSVYGGAGGFGTRISQAQPVYLPYDEVSVFINEKLTMQNLNDRLATYLDKVSSLEESNRGLELKIRQFYEKKTTTVSKDYSSYFSTISELRDQIQKRNLENHMTLLQIDNAQLAAEDFKMKYESELNLHLMLEADVSRYRSLRDSMTLNISDLELQIEQMSEELALLQKNHKEMMEELRLQQSGSVNVRVDSAKSTDLTKVLAEMREQYEAVIKKSKAEAEVWFQSKVESLQTQIVTQTSEMKEFTTQQSDLKRVLQSVEIQRSSAHSQFTCIKENIEEVSARYSSKLSNLQVTITTLEEELQELKTAIETQQTEYNLLLDIKMRLELEIAEYRRLLEGHYEKTKEVVVEQVERVKKAEQVEIVKTVEQVEQVVQVVQEVVEETKPHMEKRIKVIVEELIDGVVVARSVDVKTEDIN